ncbi:MAG: hypothetical protein WCJ30_07335 [Deltaproteobacteria bacterium]
MLVVQIPGIPVLTPGIPDYRFSWLGEAREHSSADYVVGGADWFTLVERLGVRHLLKVGAG